MKAVFLDFDTLGPGDIDTAGLAELLPDLALHPATSGADVGKRVADAEIVIVNKFRLDEAVFTAAPQLKLVCLAATGTDNVALDSAQSRGIAVCNIRAYCTASVVQHVFALILALTQHLEEYRDLLAGSAWSGSDQFCLLNYSIRELDGKTLGIVGLGELGTALATASRSFGMRLVAARLPYREGLPDNDGGDIQRMPLADLLAAADIVSLHCPLNEDTRHLIDADALAQMRTGALLINTARGGLVDSQALVDALRSGQITGAGIDVLSQEPPTDSDPLLDAQLPNLIVTPHIAWAARESRQRALDEIVANIKAFRNGERRNRVC